MIPQVDLKAAYLAHRPELDAAIARVLSSGSYILGSEVEGFEREFAAYLDVQCALGLASGTDALYLALRAAGIGTGAEVITVSHTFVATVAAIEMCGARPVFVDVDETTYTMDPRCIEPAITPRTRALLPVHLYGQVADLNPILDIAKKHGLDVIEDCAQAHGAAYQGKRAGAWGLAGCFSFYPTKNLGCLGDGGMVVTNDAGFGANLRMLRQYGWCLRNTSETPGWNSRLDEIQAAVLRVRLPHLDRDNAKRRRLAAAYDEGLAGTDFQTPRSCRDHVYHQYVVQHFERDQARRALDEHAVLTAVHYPVPVHLQPGYTRLGYTEGALPVTERVARRIISLPIFPTLAPQQQHAVIQAMRGFTPGLQPQ
jgi:dTDP-4-amino-4,6-dideoxygalactose transaminase